MGLTDRIGVSADDSSQTGCVNPLYGGGVAKYQPEQNKLGPDRNQDPIDHPHLLLQPVLDYKEWVWIGRQVERLSAPLVPTLRRASRLVVILAAELHHREGDHLTRRYISNGCRLTLPNTNERKATACDTHEIIVVAHNGRPFYVLID